MKDKNHMTISIDAEKKHLTKFNIHLRKTLNKMGIEGPYLNIIKGLYNKSTANIIHHGGKLKDFPLRSGSRQGCPHFY